MNRQRLRVHALPVPDGGLALRLGRRFATVCAILCAGAGILFGTSVLPPTFPELTNGSDYIVRAVVKSVRSEWRTANGRRDIYTLVELEVRETIAGSPPAPLVLEVLGGKVGAEELRLEGAPRFAAGDEDILFVRDNGRAIFPLFAMMHGRYPLLTDPASGRRYVARSNRVPLGDTAEVPLPLADGPAASVQRRLRSPAQALSPEEFTARIKAARDPASRGPASN